MPSMETALAHARGIHAGIMQHDDPAEGMADQADGELVDDVEQRGEIEHVLGDVVHGAGRPGAVAVSAQVERVDVVVLAQRSRHPVPVARVVQPAVDQHQRGLAVLPVVPELQL